METQKSIVGKTEVNYSKYKLGTLKISLLLCCTLTFIFIDVLISLMGEFSTAPAIGTIELMNSAQVGNLPEEWISSGSKLTPEELELFKSLSHSLESSTDTSSNLLLSSIDNSSARSSLGPEASSTKMTLISTLEKNRALRSLASIVESQIDRLQEFGSCNKTLWCGHLDACGLACQMMHRTLCLALSYTMGLPLVHNSKSGWPYLKPWHKAFKRLGSRCSSPGPDSIAVVWSIRGPQFLRNPRANSTKSARIQFPLTDGIIVPAFIGKQVEGLHENPFLWWMGQFAKYTMRLSHEQEILVNESKKELGMLGESRSPFIGVHVRRSDKALEANNSYHTIDKYFEEIRRHNLTIEEPWIHTPVRVFVASEVRKPLLQARRKFTLPNWEILGYLSNSDYPTQFARQDQLDEIIRDILILSEAEFVVCTFSSNICRLLVELKAAEHSDVGQRLTSLHGEYQYYISGFQLPPYVIYV